MILSHVQVPSLIVLFIISLATFTESSLGWSDILLDSRIIGGQKVNIKDVPYLAVVVIRKDNNLSTCGGGIISKRWILTAGHCLWKGSWQAKNQQISVAVGVSRWSDVYDDNLRPIVAYWVHSDYRDGQWYGDIAIIRLVDPVEYSDRVRPLLLPEEHEEDDWVDKVDEATIAGFGDYDGNNAFDGDLRLIHVTIFSNSKCRSYDPREDKSFSDSQFLCSGSGREAERRTTCRGDSGGPLVVEAERGLVVLGVASWAIDCGKKSGLSFYTRVSTFADWIVEVSKDYDSIEPS